MNKYRWLPSSMSIFHVFVSVIIIFNDFHSNYIFFQLCTIMVFVTFYSAVPLILTYYYLIFICYTLLILIYLLTIKLFIAPYILMYSFYCAYLTHSYQTTTVLISLCLLHVGNESQPELNLKL